MNMSHGDRKLMAQLASELRFWFQQYWDGALGGDPHHEKLHRPDARHVDALVARARRRCAADAAAWATIRRKVINSR